MNGGKCTALLHQTSTSQKHWRKDMFALLCASLLAKWRNWMEVICLDAPCMKSSCAYKCTLRVMDCHGNCWMTMFFGIWRIHWIMLWSSRVQEGISQPTVHADILSVEQEELLWQQGLLGQDNLVQLQCTVLYLLSIHLALHAGKEHRSLKSIRAPNSQLH